MARDYKSEYQKRLAKVKREGFSSPREKWEYNKAKAGRQKKLTLYNYRQSKEAQKRKKIKIKEKAKLARTKQTQSAKARALKKFGLSETDFARLRRQNKAFSAKAKSPRLYYNTDLDADLNNWSDERVGYIKYYNEVFVNPKKNKSKATRNRYAKLIDQFSLFADEQGIIEGIYEGEKIKG